MHAQGGLPMPGHRPHRASPTGSPRPATWTTTRSACAAREGRRGRRSWSSAPETVAAFIGEPVQGAGGVIIPPASYWPEIQRDLPQVRHPPGHRRGDLRLWPDRHWFGAQTLRRRARSDADRQGPVVRLPADRRRRHRRPGRRRRDRERRRFQPRLHLFRPSGGLRRGGREPAHHRAEEGIVERVRDRHRPPTSPDAGPSSPTTRWSARRAASA